MAPSFKPQRSTEVPGLPLTPRNSRLPAGFYRGTSTLYNDATFQGLYTRRKIPYRTVIGEYYGEKLTLEQAQRRNSNYQFEVRKFRSNEVEFVLDGKYKKYSSFVRYVNAANYIHQQNCKFVQRGKRIFLVARCDILPGSELLAWYGAQTGVLIEQ